jgi:hypothetical protein
MDLQLVAASLSSLVLPPLAGTLVTMAHLDPTSVSLHSQDAPVKTQVPISPSLKAPLTYGTKLTSLPTNGGSGSNVLSGNRQTYGER